MWCLLMNILVNLPCVFLMWVIWKIKWFQTFAWLYYRFGAGFCFTVVYAALLTKTNRISRIFNASKRTAKRPSFITPRSQLIICSGLVFVQVTFFLIHSLLERSRYWSLSDNVHRNCILVCIYLCFHCAKFSAIIYIYIL